MHKFNRILKYSLCPALGLCSLMCLSPAFADSCDNLDRNKTWASTFDLLNQAYEKADYTTALQYSRDLEIICDKSPILNYTIAYIQKNLNDDEKYLFYLQKATQNTERFAVDKNLLDRIWTDKYIAAHPEASPESIENYKNTIESLKADLEQARLANTDLTQSTISKDQHLQDKIDDYKTPMWIAAGIGIGGLAMAGAGAAMVAVSDSIKVNTAPAVPPRYNENAIHTAGWILVGVGSGLAISGAIFTGIFGYKYRHFNETMSFTLNISPSNTSLSIEF